MLEASSNHLSSTESALSVLEASSNHLSSTESALSVLEPSSKHLSSTESALSVLEPCFKAILRRIIFGAVAPKTNFPEDQSIPIKKAVKWKCLLTITLCKSSSEKCGGGFAYLFDTEIVIFHG